VVGFSSSAIVNFRSKNMLPRKAFRLSTRSFHGHLQLNYRNNNAVASPRPNWIPTFFKFSEEEPDEEDQYLKFLDKRYHRLHDNDPIEEQDISARNAKIVGSVLAELSSSPDSDTRKNVRYEPKVLPSIQDTTNSLFVLEAVSNAMECKELESAGDTSEIKAPSLVLSRRVFRKSVEPMIKLFSPIRVSANCDIILTSARCMLRTVIIVFLGSILDSLRSKLFKKGSLPKTTVATLPLLALMILTPFRSLISSALTRTAATQNVILRNSLTQN